MAKHRTTPGLASCALAAALAALLAPPQPSAAQQPGPGTEPQPSNTEVLLLETVKQQIKALNEEEPGEVMKVFHPQAPGAKGIRRALVNQFRLHDDRYTLLKHKYVAVDGPYASLNYHF